MREQAATDPGYRFRSSGLRLLRHAAFGECGRVRAVDGGRATCKRVDVVYSGVNSMAAAETHIFRVSLSAKIYRDFEILSAKSLHDLAAEIIRVFGFDFDHAFGFYSKLTGHVFDSPVKYELFADMGESSEARSVKRTRIVEAFPTAGAKMTFHFDYGDDWQFRIEAIGQDSKKPKAKYPRLLKTVGEAPEQYPEPDDE
jgi:hypothetical protein